MEDMIDSIVKHIKEKKELKLLDDSYVKGIVQRELARNGKTAKLIDSSKSFEQLKKKKEYKELFKEIRRKIRKAHGLFKHREEYLSNYERDYEEFNEFLLKELESSKAKNIIDLGSGLNPLFISDEVYGRIAGYHAFEIDKTLIDKMEKEKPSNKLNAGYMNLLDLKIPKELEDAKKEKNIILLLKVLEALEVFKKDFSELLIKMLKESFHDSEIIVSFAKVSSSGNQKIRKSGRAWFRRILRRLKLKKTINDFRIEDIGNEIFFIIS